MVRIRTLANILSMSVCWYSHWCVSKFAPVRNYSEFWLLCWSFRCSLSRVRYPLLCPLVTNHISKDSWQETIITIRHVAIRSNQISETGQNHQPYKCAELYLLLHKASTQWYTKNENLTEIPSNFLSKPVSSLKSNQKANLYETNKKLEKSATKLIPSRRQFVFLLFTAMRSEPKPPTMVIVSSCAYKASASLCFRSESDAGCSITLLQTRSPTARQENSYNCMIHSQPSDNLTVDKYFKLSRRFFFFFWYYWSQHKTDKNNLWPLWEEWIMKLVFFLPILVYIYIIYVSIFDFWFFYSGLELLTGKRRTQIPILISC